MWSQKGVNNERILEKLLKCYLALKLNEIIAVGKACQKHFIAMGCSQMLVSDELVDVLH